jgi:L-ascorbate metabolism protein UlaG (beta-lactamase superfamily)
MAEIALSGQELIADIDAAETPPGRAAFWWLGQHSFVVKAGGIVIYLDPYLQPAEIRQTPPPLRPEQITHADLVTGSHDHEDHIEPFAIAGIAQASPQCQFVVPSPHGEKVIALGPAPERVHGLRPGESVELSGCRITAVKAKHEFFDEGPRGFPYLSFVYEVNGICFYHSGDTLLYEGLLTTLQQWQLDAVFLPINGRDAERYLRGCLGNMTYQEAVDLAGELAPGLAVPAHWDMFANNSEDPANFVAYLEAKFPDQRYWVGEVGERVEFGKV